MSCKKQYFFILLSILLLPSNRTLSQTKLYKAFVEAGAYLSTSGQNPFWIRSNQYGIVSFESQILQLRGGYRTEYDSTRYAESNKLQKKFDYAFGGEVVGNVGKANQFLIPEVYLKTRLGAFEFYAGRRREIVGLVDTTLTSGSYIWSGNALPLPKLQISIPNYTSIIGKGLVSIKGAFAHGWFGSSDSTKNYFLHQKYLYGRLGRPNWKIKFYAGFNHQVQWGGKPHKPYIEKETGKLITTYGNDFDTYLNVVTGVSLNTKGGKDIPGVPLNDAWNRSGNHLGSVDFAMELNFKKADVLIYRQSIYDDGSLYYLNNISDGLLGISLKRKNVDKGLIGVNFEYLNTSNQGGDVYYENIEQLRGGDNYFNNSLYNWQYKYKSVGTPFIVPNDVLKQNTIISNEYLINNLVRAFHTSLLCRIGVLKYALKGVYSQNIGSFSTPFKSKKSQCSIMLNTEINTKKFNIRPLISFDSGELYKNNLGISVLLNKNF
jgi:hypothetical protein